MKLRSLARIGFTLVLAAAGSADVVDLGEGLGYLRVHSLAGQESEWQAAVTGPGALVLDLRYATADAAAVEALRTAFAAHPAGTPLFVLVSPDTPAALAAIVGTQPANVVTLGIPGSHPDPRVTPRFDAMRDRRAYDAAEAGTPLATLLSGKIEKERFDEATLVHEFKNGNPDAQPKQTPDPAAAPATPAKPEPVVDRVLQRAVHLHRALLALRR